MLAVLDGFVGLQESLHKLAGGVVGSCEGEIESDFGLRDVHLVRRDSNVKSLVGASIREQVTG